MGETAFFGSFLQKKGPSSFMIVVKQSAPNPYRFICGGDLRLSIVTTSLTDVA